LPYSNAADAEGLEVFLTVELPPKRYNSFYVSDFIMLSPD